MERFKMMKKKMVAVIWCHRMVYAGLAGAYGALCLGVMDKAVIEPMIAGLYLMLVVQR